ncbi:MAG: MurR/RpiR family transcriptional regulator [Helcococcus sp.]|nr:MurR/RpiR family transcriptional regulator [Helcococcus sp.]
MANKSYNYIMNIVSRNNVSLSNLEKSILEKLKKSDFNIAEADINTFAHEFFISNSSITRFSQKLGFNGFTELKYALSNDDTSFNYIAQERYASIINYIEKLDDDLVELIHNLDKFNKIIVVGIGSSGLLANEFIYKLGELGLYNTDYAKEPYRIDMLTANLKADDLMICLSLSGEHDNIVKGARAARSHNAKILSISGEINTRLKELSDYYIKTPCYSTHQYSISKMAPLLIYIDIICEIYSQRDKA